MKVEYFRCSAILKEKRPLGTLHSSATGVKSNLGKKEMPHCPLRSAGNNHQYADSACISGSLLQRK
ncbi:hypothetical protein [Paralysiella testudinis]|uniref:Uncharacterized protein n=1 Tax=Paralysiella testudinis TaxID=2809020 RepID=A0A892ZFS4_9NEIS|nr:hypothetical protein [Paralysiella testudinis]QRQ81493.1 hypothetical protein JQU52_12420 [Paralysiella testudinis]